MKIADINAILDGIDDLPETMSRRSLSQSAVQRFAQTRPEVQEKRSASLKKASSTPEAKKLRSELTRAQSAESRQKQSESLKKTLANPTMKAKWSEAGKKRMTPEAVEHVRQKLIEVSQTPEVQARRSAGQYDVKAKPFTVLGFTFRTMRDAIKELGQSRKTGQNHPSRRFLTDDEEAYWRGLGCPMKWEP